MNNRPNILLITCDQMQAFACGCYGNPDVHTPNIDALAESGVRFMHGISNAPVCMAGRSVLLSGQYNRTCTGGIGNVRYRGGKIGSYHMPEYPAPGRLHFPNATLPELLQQNGYDTMAIGKWHIYTWPSEIGFDHFVIPRTHHVHSAQLYVEDGVEEFAPDGWSVEYETDRACAYVEEDREDPFFLYLNYSPPHPPLNDCPDKYLKMYDPASLTIRENVDRTGNGLNEHQRRVYRWDYRYYELQLPYTLQPQDYSIEQLYADYYGNVTWLDDNVGRITQALRESGKLDNTIIVFTADHGDNLGSHGRSGKGLPCDESLRVPMIYHYPEGCPGRIDETNVAGLIDVAPTLLTSAGIRVPYHMAGRDVMSTSSDVGISEIVPGNMVARSTRFTAHLSMQDGIQGLAFYDNLNDPYQLQNLVDEETHADEREELFAMLKMHHKKVPILPKPDYGFRQ